MTTAKLTKIAAGHYTGPRGEARNVYSASGAAHTKSSGARWLVTTTNGKTTLVARLSTVRMLIA